MIEREIFPLSVFLFFIGLLVVFFAGLIGITTPFLAFSYIVLEIGLVFIAIAEIGIFLMIVISIVKGIKMLRQKRYQE